MPLERSAGAIIVRKTRRGLVYLLLQHSRHPSWKGRGSRRGGGHWSFAKGHLEKGESPRAAARREIQEETGIRTVSFVSGFRTTIRYFIHDAREKKQKIVHFLLVETSQRKVHISAEHQGYVWLPFEKAKARVTYTQDRLVLQEAHAFLTRA